jgi:hypothetical protein
MSKRKKIEVKSKKNNSKLEVKETEPITKFVLGKNGKLVLIKNGKVTGYQG